MADHRAEQSVVNRTNNSLLVVQSGGSDGISPSRINTHAFNETVNIFTGEQLPDENLTDNFGPKFGGGEYAVEISCDAEDRGCLNLNNDDSDKSNKFLPQLVFHDSEENVSRIYGDNISSDIVNDLPRTERSVSDSGVANGYVPNDRSSLLLDSFSNPLLSGGKSEVSLQSNDSDLLTDHSVMVLESESNDKVNGGDIEHLLRSEVDDDNDDNHSWHCHSANQSFPVDRMARNQLIIVSILCFLFMVGEAVGGILSNSLALFTDVLHLGSDLISFLISLLSMYLAKKPATRNMSFGYHRAEVLGALFSVFIIWSVTGVLVYVAIERIVHKHYKDVKPDEMLITAVLGVVFNLVMGFVLHSEMCCGGSRSVPSFGHGHSHGHSHSGDNHRSTNHHRSHNHSHSSRGDSYQPLLGDDQDEENLQMNECVIARRVEHVDKPHPKNINVRAAFIHVIGDIIQSLGVLLASIIIKIKPEEKYRLADPICTFLFSLLVLLTTINVLKDTLRIILEGVPRDTDYGSIKSSFQKITGVKAVHGLTMWCLTLEKNALAVHLAVDPSYNHKQVLRDASAMLQRDYNFLHSTIQVEDYNDEIMTNCVSCTDVKK